jgi:hypothetical protein
MCIIIWDFHYMTLHTTDVIPELTLVCRLLQPRSQSNDLKSPY